MKFLKEALSTFVFLTISFFALSYGYSLFGILGAAILIAFAFVFIYLLINNENSRVYLNPILVFYDLLSKKISGKDFWICILAQVVASITGALLVFFILLLFPKGISIIMAGNWVSGFGTLSTIAINTVGSLIFEIILSFVFVILFVVLYKKCETNSLRALFLGLLVGLICIISFRITSSLANPAKGLGPALVYLIIGEIVLIPQFVVLCLADFLGTLFAFLVVKKFNVKQKDEYIKKSSVSKPKENNKCVSNNTEPLNKPNEELLIDKNRQGLSENKTVNKSTKKEQNYKEGETNSVINTEPSQRKINVKSELADSESKEDKESQPVSDKTISRSLKVAAARRKKKN